MGKNMNLFLMGVKKSFSTYLNLIETIFYKIRKEIILSYQVLCLLKSQGETMNKKEKLPFQIKAEEMKAEEVTNTLPKQEAVTVDPHHVKYAYSMIENEGKYHVVSVEFDPNTLVSGKVKKIESNTDKFLMQERLQVLLMGDDLI